MQRTMSPFASGSGCALCATQWCHGDHPVSYSARSLSQPHRPESRLARESQVRSLACLDGHSVHVSDDVTRC